MNPGDIVTLEVEKPVAGGRMLARHDGRVVLVGGSIPGERVQARVARIAAGVAYADVVDVLAASPDRRAPDEDWSCGGNVYSHIAYDRQRALKSEIAADAFSRIARITLDPPPAVEPSPPRGYRMRARLHAADGLIGFFREGTHRVCDAGASGQLSADAVDTVHAVQAACAGAHAAFPIVVELSENVPASERAIHIELPAEDPRLPPAALADIPHVTGVSLSVVRDRELTTVYGEPYVHDTLAIGSAGVGLRRHVRAFFQGNRYLVGTLVARVLDRVPAGDDVLDLYAGGGLFAIALAARGETHVTAVEGDPFAGEDLRWNGRLYGKTLRTYRRSVEEYLHDHPSFGATIVLDPPRTGMSPEAAARIRSAGARRLVYVSCDVATLARDMKGLVGAGYRVEHVEAFDLFPNTAHIETLVVLVS